MARPPQPFFGHGKPVVVTELGMRSCRGADTSGTLGFGVVDRRSVILHQLSLVGRFVRPRLKGAQVRDEAIAPFSEDPKYDLDMSALSLVKSYVGRRGMSYPDMTWEPKESFRAVADYYAERGALSQP